MLTNSTNYKGENITIKRDGQYVRFNHQGELKGSLFIGDGSNFHASHLGVFNSLVAAQIKAKSISEHDLKTIMDFCAQLDERSLVYTTYRGYNETFFVTHIEENKLLSSVCTEKGMVTLNWSHPVKKAYTSITQISLEDENTQLVLGLVDKSSKVDIVTIPHTNKALLNGNTGTEIVYSYLDTQPSTVYINDGVVHVTRQPQGFINDETMTNGTSVSATKFANIVQVCDESTPPKKTYWFIGTWASFKLETLPDTASINKSTARFVYLNTNKKSFRTVHEAHISGLLKTHQIELNHTEKDITSIIGTSFSPTIELVLNRLTIKSTASAKATKKTNLTEDMLDSLFIDTVRYYIKGHGVYEQDHVSEDKKSTVLKFIESYPESIIDTLGSTFRTVAPSDFEFTKSVTM